MKRIVLISLISCTIFATACNNGCEREFRLEQDYVITFELFEEGTDNNLLEIASYYDRNGVEIYDGNENVLFTGPVSGDGRVFFAPYLHLYPEKEIPIDKDTTEYYYLHLSRRNDPAVDIDTFRVDYRAFINDCSEKKFTNIIFYYNDKIVFSDDQERHRVTVTLYKSL